MNGTSATGWKRLRDEQPSSDCALQLIPVYIRVGAETLSGVAETGYVVSAPRLVPTPSGRDWIAWTAKDDTDARQVWWKLQEPSGETMGAACGDAQ